MPKTSTRAVSLIVLGLILSAIAIVACRDADESPAAASNEPNFVIILTDDQRYDELRAQRYTRSRGDWARFERAVLENPLCCPSRASILTGQYDFHTGVLDNSPTTFDASSTLATALDGAGYETALVGKYLNKYPFEGQPEVPPGWDNWTAFYGDEKALYFDYLLYEDGEFVRQGSDPEDYSTDVLARKAKQFIGSTEDPFFLYFAPRSPHSPDVPAPRHEDAHVPKVKFPPSFNERDVSDKPGWVQELEGEDRSEMKAKIKARWRMMMAADDAIRTIFRALKRSGELDQTYVIFLSDNGYMLGEHRMYGKSCGYEECIRTPLLIRGPGVKPGEVKAPVSNVDLLPTIADLAGVEPGHEVDGVSLRPLLEGETRLAGRSGVLLHARPLERSRPEWLGVTTRRYKLIRTKGGELELYDLKKDPYELENVAGKRRYADERERLIAMMKRLRPPLDRNG